MPISLRQRETVIAQVEEEVHWVAKDIHHPLHKKKLQDDHELLKNITLVMAEEEYEIEEFVRVISLGINRLNLYKLFWGRMFIILLVDDKHLNDISGLIRRLEDLIIDVGDTSAYHEGVFEILQDVWWVRDKLRVLTRDYR